MQSISETTLLVELEQAVGTLNTHVQKPILLISYLSLNSMRLSTIDRQRRVIYQINPLFPIRIRLHKARHIRIVHEIFRCTETVFRPRRRTIMLSSLSFNITMSHKTDPVTTHQSREIRERLRFPFERIDSHRWVPHAREGEHGKSYLYEVCGAVELVGPGGDGVEAVAVRGEV